MAASRMTAVDLLVEPAIDPALSLATDRYLMRAVGRRSRMRNAVLRVYSLPGDMVALGRYHLTPTVSADAPVRLYRRACGGRALPFGDGFVGISLILPHRAALVADDPLTLAPYQVLNRYVRGILEACQIATIPAVYPGRDVITVDRRILAAVSCETDEHGALLFEAVVSNARDFSILPSLLDQVDGNGVVKIQMLGADGATSLARELRRALSVEELGELLRRGFAKRFNVLVEPYTLSPLERQVIEAMAHRECEPHQWLQQRCMRADMEFHASVWVQLGVFEAHVALQQDQFIKDILFSGDFIANSPAVEALERELRLCPVEGRAIETIAGQIFSRPENFILGIGKLRTIAETIVRAVHR